MKKNEIKKTNKSMARRLSFSGIVIALYVVLMFYTQSFAFGQYQVRIATSLYALAAIDPILILPLGLANMLSNMLMGGLGPLDMIGGFLVGILTSCSCYFLGRKYDFLVAIPIAFIPSLIVPIWLSYILKIPYILLVLSIGIGQLLPAIVGVIIVKNIKKFMK